MKYNKLVRDKIPEYIQLQGGNSVTHIADDAEYWKKLKEKVLEEFDEFQEDESLEEFADLLEVMQAMAEYKKFDSAAIEEVRKKKADERGKFQKRIILEQSSGTSSQQEKKAPLAFSEFVQKAKEIKQKYAVTNEKQWGIAEYAQGLVGDVGELVQLVMSKNGFRKKDNVDAALAHELSDCLWAILVLSDELGVDLEKEFMTNMKKLSDRIERENEGRITLSNIT